MAREEAGARTADDVMGMVGGGGGGARRAGWVDVVQSRLWQRQCSAGCGKGGEGGEGQGGMRGGGQQQGGGDRGGRRGRRRRRLGGKGRGERRWRGRLDWLADGHRGQLVEVRRSRGRGSQLAHSPVEGLDGACVAHVAALAHAGVDGSIDGRVELKGEVGRDWTWSALAAVAKLAAAQHRTAKEHHGEGLRVGGGKHRETLVTHPAGRGR